MMRSRRLFCAASPALLLIAAGAAGVAKATLAAANGSPRVIRIEARKFAYAPNLIRIAPGEAVTLALLALDFPHGFNIPGLKLRADLAPGQVVTLQLKVEQAGQYAFLCDNFCGSGHEEMHGTLIVAPA
jgi:cytochrome c oxidase subunit 2